MKLGHYKIVDSCQVQMTRKLLGGAARTIKTRLNRGDAVRLLKMRTARPVRVVQQIDTNPIVIRAEEEMNQMNQSIANDEPNILQNLLSDIAIDKLVAIRDGLSTCGSDTVSKLVRFLPEICDTYSRMEQACDFVSNLKTRYEQCMVDLYIKEWTTCKDEEGEMMFDNKSFKKMMDTLIERKTLQEQIRQEMNAPAPAVAATRCVIS